MLKKVDSEALRQEEKEIEKFLVDEQSSASSVLEKIKKIEKFLEGILVLAPDFFSLDILVDAQLIDPTEHMSRIYLGTAEGKLCLFAVRIEALYPESGLYYSNEDEEEDNGKPQIWTVTDTYPLSRAVEMDCIEPSCIENAIMAIPKLRAKIKEWRKQRAEEMKRLDNVLDEIIKENKTTVCQESSEEGIKADQE